MNGYGAEDLASPFTEGFQRLMDHLSGNSDHNQDSFLPTHHKTRKHIPKVYHNRKSRRRMQKMSRRVNR